MKLSPGDIVTINGERVTVIRRRYESNTWNGRPCLCLVVADKSQQEYEYRIEVESTTP
jgi:hypothetical protein